MRYRRKKFVIVLSILAVAGLVAGWLESRDGGTLEAVRTVRTDGSVPTPRAWAATGYRPQSFEAVDPRDAKTVYVNSDALYASGDGGRTWHGTSRWAGGVYEGPILVLPSIVYALRAADDHPCSTCDRASNPWFLYASTDRGASWREVAHYQVGGGVLFGLTAGATPGSVFVLTSRGLFLHVPGRRESERDGGLLRSYGDSPSVPLVARSGQTLYAGVATGDNDGVVQVYASNDEGRNWHLRRNPFKGASGALIGDPTSSRIAYAVVDLITRKSMSRIYRTADSANSWRELWHGCIRSPANANVAEARLVAGSIVFHTCAGVLRRIAVRPPLS